jgi:hypothetical protein
MRSSVTAINALQHREVRLMYQLMIVLSRFIATKEGINAQQIASIPDAVFTPRPEIKACVINSIPCGGGKYHSGPVNIWPTNGGGSALGSRGDTRMPLQIGRCMQMKSRAAAGTVLRVKLLYGCVRRGPA